MPCIFCVAVFVMLAGAVTSVVLDQMQARLSTVATGPVERAVDSSSVARFDTTVAVPGDRGTGRAVPVAVTVYKKHRRVRIQVMTHDLTRTEAELVENLVAEALGLAIVDRSDAHDEQKVREAFGGDGEPAGAAADGREAVTAEPGATERPREPGDGRRAR